MSPIKTYTTKYGKISLYGNEYFIGGEFNKGEYWDEDTLIELKEYVDPGKNILEIGAHCGTSSIIYSSFLNEGSKCYAFEPQKKIFDLLELNIHQNNLQAKVECINKGVFCYTGPGNMNDVDLDGGGGIIERRLAEESDLPCNFGGAALGRFGEQVELTTVDDMDIDNIGFIHCDAQGSESFIFSNAIDTIKKYRPVIFFENNKAYGSHLYRNVCEAYPEFIKERDFDITAFCMNELSYSNFIDRFNDSNDTLLIP